MFSILRLVSHVQSGKAVDRSLVFTQASKPLGYLSPQASRSTSPVPPMVKRFTAPMVQTLSSSTVVELTPDQPSLNSTPTPTKNDSKQHSSLGSNPFRRSVSHTPQPFLQGSAIADDDDGRSSPIRDNAYSPTPRISRAPSSGSIKAGGESLFQKNKKTGISDSISEGGGVSRNPFLARSNSNSNSGPSQPPLPPRKPATMLPPPRHPAPPPPPKPSSSSKPSPSLTTPHQTSNLIKQSLIAARTAQKASESALHLPKTWEVIKSSVNSGTLKERAKDRGAATRKSTETATDSSMSTAVHSRVNPSPPSSASSLEHSISSSRKPPPLPTKSRPHSRSTSPTKPRPEDSPTKLSMEEIDDIITIHSSKSAHSQPSPYADSSAMSSSSSPTTGRPTRSKSLHTSSPSRSPVPPPPPARRRPESIQVLPSPSENFGRGISPNRVPSLSRHASMHSPGHGHSHSHSGSSHKYDNPLSSAASDGASVASSFYTSLKQKAKATEAALHPEFEKFAWKAEGNLAPSRGYLSHRGVEGERLMTAEPEDDSDNSDRPHRITSKYAFVGNKATGGNISDGKPGMDVDLDRVTTDDTGTSVDWTEWERTRKETMERGRLARSMSGATTPQSQRAAVQMELDELRGLAQQREASGWSRLSG
ncbi:hypothetical protein FRC02_001713 [Tulasnella sp. 418]|nr:hypothetical protein FRC02_001713 [Tulasnella sp. 418]